MILYIGNKLSKHGNTPTSVEILGDLLSQHFHIVSVSDKKNKMLRLAEMLWSIVRYRHTTEFVLIDTYSTSNFYYAVLSGALAKTLRIKYIPVLRGGNLPERVERNPRLAKLLFANAYVNVAPSRYLLSTFESSGYKTVFIPNNIEIKHYPFKLRRRIEPKLLYVRAFSSVYNPKMALFVLKKLLHRYPEASLCMVGPDRDGTFASTRELCHTMGLDDKVTFTGKLSKEEWWKLSESYDVFINTTNFDNTPVSVMEAMALGLPVVSTNVGGIPYLVEEDKEALLVDADDAEAMAEKISQLIENPDKAVALAENARKKVEGFDWKNVQSKWFELLKKKEN